MFHVILTGKYFTTVDVCKMKSESEVVLSKKPHKKLWKSKTSLEKAKHTTSHRKKDTPHSKYYSSSSMYSPQPAQHFQKHSSSQKLKKKRNKQVFAKDDKQRQGIPTRISGKSSSREEHHTCVLNAEDNVKNAFSELHNDSSMKENHFMHTPLEEQTTSKDHTNKYQRHNLQSRK